jgi:glycine/D-amino acid oxidase-like deaminating enzyme
MPPMQKSFLIIGQGIAGSLLAWTLMKKGHQVLLVDDHHHESSSMISAGIINPITGQRLAMTPEFDLFYQHAMATYAQISHELQNNFFIPKPIIRVLRSQEELERARYLESLPATKPYVAAIHAPGHYGEGLHDPFGTLAIAQGGYLQTALFLTALRTYFLNRQRLVSEALTYSDLKVSEQNIQWKSQTFDRAIFCEGFKARQNPWFKELPYNLAKGEILRVALESANLPDAILCQQQWCLPTLNGTYLAGSTYDRQNINTCPSEEGQSTILKGLKDFIPGKVQVLESYAAVRPVMLDPRPISLMHPTYPRLGIFNGFGSKGILWAPYYAENFSLF